jgi:putative aminopeptidase FrvX
MKNIFLEVGATSKDEVEKMGIHVGCVATFDDEFMVLNDRYYMGRALDNRVGGFMIAEVARILKENKVKLPFGVYFTNSVQEEIGLRGAEMIAHRIQPDVAIITDVCHDSQTPMMSKIMNGDLACGKGPVLSYGPAVQNNLLQHIIDQADKNKIAIQRQAASRSTGTDTDAFAYSNAGVASALISLPLRYMHTTVEMVHKKDVEDVIKLIYHSLITIKNNKDWRYIK